MLGYIIDLSSVFFWPIYAISSTSAPPTTGAVPVVIKTINVVKRGQIIFNDIPAALVYLCCGLGKFSSDSRASGTYSMGLLSVKSIF